MRRFVALCVSLLLLPLNGLAVGENTDELALSAQSAILMDAESGRVLYEKNMEEPRPIASITKLMTALVAVSVCDDLDEMVTVQPVEAAMDGSSLYLKAGEEISVGTLLYGMLLESGNDSAEVLARHLAGERELFVEWMNQRAATLGMKNTLFSNPSGLPGGEQYSTAYDVALMCQAALEHELIGKIVATKNISRDERHFTNHNKLLWNYEGCIGLKTGYTDDAGRTLASAARRDGQTLIAVTLKASDDWEDHAAMLDFGFAAYPRTRLVQGGREFRGIEVRGALERLVRVVPNASLYYPLRADEQVRMEIELPNWVQAPVQTGGIAGSIRFYLDDQPVAHSYLIYTATIEENAITRGGAFRFFRSLIGEKSREELFDIRYEALLPQAVTVSLPTVRKNYYAFGPY